ncbi:MAG: YdcF family protein [Flavobacteriales bacterium]|nr:YdcF family protein [Flavobacteriales bacterium]
MRLWKVGLAVFFVVILWSAREAILRDMGRLLIKEDELMHADLIYALGGAPLERGQELAALLAKGSAPMGVTTGGNPSHSLQAYGMDVLETELTRQAALRVGADQQQLDTLARGTSTWEEAAHVLADARSRGADTIIVVTTEFHTRRVGRVFRKRFKGSGVVVLVHGARSLDYDPQRWWDTEEGLLMVNNEYVKLLYYALKY